MDWKYDSSGKCEALSSNPSPTKKKKKKKYPSLKPKPLDGFAVSYNNNMLLSN
jgi:hypothetical protein